MHLYLQPPNRDSFPNPSPPDNDKNVENQPDQPKSSKIVEAMEETTLAKTTAEKCAKHKKDLQRTPVDLTKLTTQEFFHRTRKELLVITAHI